MDGQLNFKISISDRVKYIEYFPCFITLTEALKKELASLMQVLKVPPQTVIVKENELVDSVFIIASGEAEVTKEQKKFKRVTQVPVAILSKGEAIGLNDTGFYSSTGKRTATVASLSSMFLLKLDLEALHKFLKKNHLENAMYEASLQMLRIAFIKQCLPFSKLSHVRLQWLSSHVQEMKAKKGTVLFEQGDEGKKCYLIRSGQVEIYSKTKDEKKHHYALLKSPTLFGEATLITRSKRNASAEIVEDSDLLVLSHENLSELIETESNVAQMFMNLMIDRSKPLKNPDVTMHHRTTADGEDITILKNPENDSYFKLSKEGLFIWNELNGNHTLRDITLNFSNEFNAFAPDVVAALIYKLSKSNFIKNLKIDDELQLAIQPLWIYLMLKIQKILESRIAFGDSDSWITRMYHGFIKYFFTKTAHIFFAILMVLGFFSFVVSTDDVLLFFSVEHASLLLLLILIPFSIAELFLHELGHAFTVKSFDRKVHYIGIGWNWFSPIAFTDTTDMWLSDRASRMWVNFAGVYVDILIAGMASLLIWVVPNLYIQGMLWLFALYTYISAFRMLSPLQEMDGYFLLMDWVEKNRLRQTAVVWLIKKFPKCLKNPKLFRENWPEVSFWIAVLIFLILVTIITLAVQHFVFRVLGIEPSNPYSSLIIPFLVVLVSCVSVIAEIKNQARISS